VSTGSEVSVLGPRNWAVASGASARRAERPLVRLATFSALGLYGVLRWETLMRPAASSRLLGMLALAIVVAGVGAALAERHRRLAIGVAAIAVIAMFPIAGIPFTWIRHVRIDVTANAIGQGLTALPNVLVPYLGINPWVRVVVVLGAGVLLLDAALLAAFSPRSIGDLRRAGAALPLVALAVVPTTLVKPHLPYLQGVILFVLLAAFMWAERAPTRDVATAVAVVGLAGIGGALVAPRIDPRRAWVNYESLAGTLIHGHIDRFDWSQTYGPLVWPQVGEEVLDVQAKRPDYWKAENLDVFDGTAWTTGYTPPLGQTGIYPSAVAQWTQTIQVTIRAMRTIDVIAAGTAQMPTHVAEGVISGISPGTWQAGAPLQPGDTYRVTTYEPQPTSGELAAAGTNYPAQLIPDYLELTIPGSFVRHIGHVPEQPVFMTPFGQSAAAVYGPTATNAPTALAISPYARVYALAQRLKRGTATPYAFVQNVMAYLHHGFTYDQATPVVQYPLAAFLLRTKRGYCQQFAGAMALLLRMGGVPARVGVGFTHGAYNTATHEYVVEDTDAHAWVEAWFPGYGWVRFDPTPAVAPALGGAAAAAPKNSKGTNGAASNGHGLKGPATAKSKGHGHGRGSFPIWIMLVGLAGVAALVVIGLGLRRRVETDDELLAELERALTRCGRPIADGVTLAALEQRFRSSPGAVGYVRAIRIGRYGGSAAPPTRTERRALRAALAAGLGLGGRLRAIWALPPRR
jgi:protein-glutamine gamma-glutamyltransferase